jgi:hypothetical protein
VDLAIAGELSDVDSRTVIAGGTAKTKRPHDFKKSRRSSSLDSGRFAGLPMALSIYISGFKVSTSISLFRIQNQAAQPE